MSTPSGTIPNTDSELVHLITLAGVCCLGYIGRAVGKKIFHCLSNTCCQGYCEQDASQFADALLVGSKDGSSGVTLAAVEGQSMTWKEARVRLQLNSSAALSVSILRLLFFHWSQPIGYGVALYLYWHSLPFLQLILGCVVLFREVVYILLTLVAIRVNPAFLLVDSSATFQSSGWNLLLYVVCPEKFVYFCLGVRTNVPLLILILCDLSGIAALVAAIQSGVTPVPLMIGYGITTLGGLAALMVVLILPLWSVGCGCGDPNIKLVMMSIINGTGSYERLDLSASPDIVDVTGILGALKRNTTLKRLNLCNVELFIQVPPRGSLGSLGSDDSSDNSRRSGQQRGISILADSLRSNTTLLELDMDWTLMGTEALATLYSTNHPSLPTTLSLRNLRLDIADGFRLSKLLRTTTIVTVLDVAHNNLGDQGSAALADTLRETRTLKGVDLSANDIGDVGAMALAEGMHANVSLLWLFLYDNEEISNKSIAKLVECSLSTPKRAEMAVGVSTGRERKPGGRRTTAARKLGRRDLSKNSKTLLPQRPQVLPSMLSSSGEEKEKKEDVQDEQDEQEKRTIKRKGHHSRSFSTLELTWEIQLQQLMALCACTLRELRLMLERNFVFTKLNVFGAAKYKKLKNSAHRLLFNFQTILGSRNAPTKKQRTRTKLRNTTSSKQLVMKMEANKIRKEQFLALLNRMSCKNPEKPSENYSEKTLTKLRSSKCLLMQGESSSFVPNQPQIGGYGAV